MATEMRRTSQAIAVFVALAFVSCDGEGADEATDAVSADELPGCLREAGLTVARNGEELLELEGIGPGGFTVFPSTGTAGFNATSVYNEDATPPWELLLVRRAGPAREDDSEEALDLSEIVNRFEEFAAVAYVQPRDEAAIQRAFDRCVD